MRSLRVTAALAVMMAGAVPGAAAEATAPAPHVLGQTATPARNGLISFQVDPGAGRSIIETVRPNGTHLRALVADPEASVSLPDWSPDGRLLVYVKDTDTGCHIILAHRDGTLIRDLTGSRSGCESVPTFAPSGHRIVFVFQRCERCRTWIGGMNIFGQRRHRIRAAASDTEIEDVVLSPNGRQVAFESGLDPDIRPFQRALLVMRRNGTHLRTLVPYRFDAGTHFDWSTTGRWLVYTRWSENPQGHEANVVLISPDGSRHVQLTGVHRTGFGAGGATFSPDGRMVVYRFADLEHERFWITTMHVDGTHKTRIRELSAPPQGTVWAPQVRQLGGRSLG